MRMRTAPYSLTLGGMLFAAVGLIQCLFSDSDGLAWKLITCIPFLVIGGGLYMLGTWLDRKYGPPEPEKVFSPKSVDTRFIVQVLARQRRIGLIGGVSLLAFDALFLILFAANSGDDQNAPAHPAAIAAIVAVIAILFEVGAALCLYKALKHWNIEETDVYKLLTAAPHRITGLTRHTFESHAPVGRRRRENMIELSVENRKFRLSVNGEQFVSLKRYIATHSPRAWYREEAHHV